MPVSFKKVKKEAAPFDESVPAPAAQPAAQPVPAAVEHEAPKGWMARGAKAKALYDAAPDAGDFTSFRFFLKESTGSKITFLDGEVDPSTGFFDTLMIFEHQVEYAGSYYNYFPCTWKNDVPENLKEPCPICASGNKAYIVAYFTVIDHGEYTSKDGKKSKDRTRMFAAKKKTISMLLRIASQKTGGGLSGARFTVYRDGERDARVGNSFDFVKKFSVPALLEKYKTHVADYEENVPWKTRAELIAMGVVGAPVGSEPGAVTGDDINVEEDL